MRSACCKFFVVGVLLCNYPLFAQGQSQDQDSPKDPSRPQANSSSTSSAPAPAPNPPPEASLSLGGKFHYYAKATFWPQAYIVPGLIAGYHMANPPTLYPREWRQGAEAFGRNYGDAFGRHVATQSGKFVTAALLREDPRYSRATDTGFFGRSFHALMFTFVDKGDSGHRRVAFANFVGAAAGGFFPMTYLPDGYHDLSHAYTRSARGFGIMGGRNLAQEFSPELKRAAKKLHVPFVHD